MTRLAVAQSVAAVAALVIVCATPCLAAEEVVAIPTRDSVTLSYLLVHDPAAKPKVVAVSFVGGRGVLGLRKKMETGSVKFGPAANFLVRVRDQMSDADIADALVDSPSDALPDGMSDAFRMGKDHAADIRAVIRDLNTRFPTAKIFLIGTSRGTISAAALGASLPDLISGVVLSSTVTNSDRVGAALSTFDFAAIKVPVLLVHNRDDGCRTSPYSGAQRLAKQFPLITVSGSDPPQTEPCEPLAPHGYFGRETATVQAIRNWLLGREFARDIG